MPDTPRTLAEILALFADNATGEITPQDLRDFVVSLTDAVAGGGFEPALGIPAKPASGQWIGTPFLGGDTTSVIAGTSAASNGLAVFSPFPIAYRQSFDRIAAAVRTANAGAGAVMRLGVYDSTGASGLPGALIEDAGTVAITTTGAKEVPFAAPRELGPGLYWMALVPQNLDTAGTNPAFTSGAAGGFAPVAAIGSSPPAANANVIKISQTGVTGALPDPATPVVAQQTTTQGIWRPFLRAA